jgi:hypothetical protein
MHPPNGLTDHPAFELLEEVPDLREKEEEIEWVFYELKDGETPKSTVILAPFFCLVS